MFVFGAVGHGFDPIPILLTLENTAILIFPALLSASGCRTFDEVKAVINGWLDYYNNECYQWQFARLAPNEYYQYIMTGSIRCQ